MNLKELRQRFQEDKLPRQLKDPKKEARDLILPGNITVITITKDGKRKEIEKKDLQRWKDDGWKLAEDAPANAVGDGSNVALPPTHEPGIQPKKKKKEENKFSTFLTRYQKESFSERELVLQTSNDETLYRKQIQPIILNLARKKAKGVFDKNLAVKLFRYAVDNKVKELAGPSSRMVPGTIRNKVADKLLSIFDGEIDDKVKDLK